MALILDTVPHAVAEIDQKTHSHPHREADPGVSAELHHQINVHKDTDDRQEGQQRNHEGDFLAGLGLPADHEDTEAEEQETERQQN